MTVSDTHQPAPAPRRRRAEAPPAPTTAPPQPPAPRSWEQKPHAQLTLLSRAGMEQNDDLRLTFLRLIDLRAQRRLFNRLWKDRYPYFILTSPTPFETLRGSTLALLPRDLADGFSLVLLPRQSGKVNVFVHADEAAVAVYRKALADFTAKHGEVTVNGE